MTNRKKQVLALLLALSMLLLLSACGGRASSVTELLESTGGKDLEKAASLDHVFSLNCNRKWSFRPSVATNHANQLICCLVYENMVEVDNDFNVIPNIITEWSCSSDGKSWQFTIDTSWVFHDGSNVGGNDLRLSLENAIHSDRYSGRFASVQGVSYSADTLYVTLGIGNTQFVKLMNIPVVKSGTFGDDHPIGCGPYTWDASGDRLIAFKDYPSYSSLPVKEIYIKEYTEAAEILNAFENGLIDAAINDPSSFTNLGYASTNERRTFATTNMVYVAFNEEKGYGRYGSVRAALSYAFDRDHYAEDLMDNCAVASSVPMVPSCELYPSALAAEHGFDLDKCLLILHNYGVDDYDEDGRLELAKGSSEELELTFIVPADSSAKCGVANRFAADVADIGVNVIVEELSWEDYTQRLEDGEFDMYIGEVKLRNDFDLTELLQVRTKDNEKTNINYSRSTDSSFETLINNYLAASDSTRQSRYIELCQHLFDSGSLITIGFERQELVTHRGVVRGAEPNAGNPLFGFAAWEIDLT